MSDLEGLVKDTHKFEAEYTKKLIGKYPEEKEKYQRLSPINSADKICVPVAFFQGMEDKVGHNTYAEKTTHTSSYVHTNRKHTKAGGVSVALI